MTNLLGKYILEDWECNGFKSRSLRWLNREGKQYYMSDVARTCVDYDKGLYGFRKRWSQRFVKVDSEIGFKRSVTHLSNTDGVMEYSVYNTPADCKCEYTFDEVFGNDVRDIQHEDNSPLDTKKYMLEELNKSENWVKPTNFWKIHLTAEVVNGNPTRKPIKGDYFEDFYIERNLFVTRLASLFDVTNVYRISSNTICEREHQSILTKSTTFFHFNQFKSDEKTVSREDVAMNDTISFWLFDDKLVYQHESGKGTW